MKSAMTILLTIAVIAASFSFSGCGEEKLPTAEEIKESAIASLSGLKTYQTGMDMELDICSTVKDEERKLTILIISECIVDLERRESKVAIDNYVTEYPVQQIPREQLVRLYYVDNVLYIKAETIFQDPEWRKTEPDDNFWEDINNIQLQADMLEASQVEYIGTEDFHGVECYVLRLIPDIKQAWELLTRHTMLSGQAGAFMPFNNVRELPWSFSLKLWIARDTLFISGLEAYIGIEIPQGNSVLPDEEGMITFSMNTWTYNHNEDVYIELSPEAEAAILEP